MERRRFIVTAGGTLAVAGAAAVVDAPQVIAQPSYTKFQAQHTGWSRVSEGAYQQFVAL